ncbi:MAG: Hpt domain-containing protein, partial [Candidatus Cloacimonetes bacterium]|nr:Hpt domain-containing protein [Candidatus Cloacimonadota bacterium]
MGIETENKEILSELLDSYENLVLHPETIMQNWDKSLKEIFRWVHTVKGAYGFMDMQAQADFLHEFETGLQKLQALEANQSNTQIVIQGLDKIHDDLMCLLGGSPSSLLTASASYLIELQKISSLKTLGIEDVIGALEDTLARLKLMRNYQKSSEEVKVFYDKVLEFSQFFANKEDFRVSVVVNSLLLKNVIHEGVDLTHSVRQVLRGIEHLIMGSSEIDVSEANRHLSMFLKTIHYTKGIANFTQLLATREVLPELLEDFYRLFWEELVASTDKVELMDGNELVSLTDESQSPDEEVATTKETPVAQIETVKVDGRYLSQFTQNVESLIMYRNYLDNLESEIRPCLPSAMATDLKYGLHEF